MPGEEEGAATFYDTLGVASDCPPEQLRRAYNAAALRHHPDRAAAAAAAAGSEGTGAVDTEAFRCVQEAWETLRDPALREAYDLALKRAARALQPAASAEVDLDEMECSAAPGGGGYRYKYPCRCGDSFEVPESEIPEDQTSMMIPCSSCSLYIRVLYAAT